MAACGSVSRPVLACDEQNRHLQSCAAAVKLVLRTALLLLSLVWRCEAPHLHLAKLSGCSFRPALCSQRAGRERAGDLKPELRASCTSLVRFVVCSASCQAIFAETCLTFVSGLAAADQAQSRSKDQHARYAVVCCSPTTLCPASCRRLVLGLDRSRVPSLATLLHPQTSSNSLCCCLQEKVFTSLFPTVWKKVTGAPESSDTGTPLTK